MCSKPCEAGVHVQPGVFPVFRKLGPVWKPLRFLSYLWHPGFLRAPSTDGSNGQMPTSANIANMFTREVIFAHKHYTNLIGGAEGRGQDGQKGGAKMDRRQASKIADHIQPHATSFPLVEEFKSVFWEFFERNSGSSRLNHSAGRVRPGTKNWPVQSSVVSVNKNVGVMVY